jgi:tetratricopeptide (TPR) repeat protein
VSAAPTIPIRPPTYAAGYAVRDVARLTGLGIPQISGFVRAGTVAPRRGPRREYRFSFQDLVVLRTAADLLEKMSSRKLHRALRRLREHLPNGRQLATVRIAWEGDELVVREGAVSWNPESGQALLDLDVARLAIEVAPLALQSAAEAFEPDRDLGAEDWYQVGCELEPHDPARAQEAYRRSLELQPGHPDAVLNLGRLFHETGRITEAEACYRRALEARPGDATAAFNLGVALQDLGRLPEAVAAYEQTLETDPGYADAHYNLSQLHERLGHGHSALRHLQAYRGLKERARTPAGRS